eukprot:SAG31_NODE_1893_length_6973_cov_5.870963_3_plen_228_part_00
MGLIGRAGASLLAKTLLPFDDHPFTQTLLGKKLLSRFLQLFEKYGTLTEIYTALIEKVSALIANQNRQPGAANPEVERRVTAERSDGAATWSLQEAPRASRPTQLRAVCLPQRALSPRDPLAGGLTAKRLSFVMLRRRGRGGGSAQTSRIGPSITQTRFYDQLDVKKVNYAPLTAKLPSFLRSPPQFQTAPTALPTEFCASLAVRQGTFVGRITGYAGAVQQYSCRY